MFIYTIVFTGTQILDCSAHYITIQDSEKHWTRSATCSMGEYIWGNEGTLVKFKLSTINKTHYLMVEL